MSQGLESPEARKHQHKVKILTNPLGVEQPVTSVQFCAHFQITPRTLANWRAEKRIPFFRLSAKNFRYRLSECERVLAANGGRQ